MSSRAPYEEEEGRRRRALFRFLLGSALVVLLGAGGFVAIGGNRPEAAGQGPKTSSSPTPSFGVELGSPQAGSASNNPTPITPQAAGGNGQGNNGNGNGNGGSNTGSTPTGKALNLSGVVQGQVAPSRNAILVVTINNPNNQDILVTSVTGTVTSVTSAGQSGKPACSTSWYSIGSYSGSLLIKKNASGTASLPVSFLNSPTVNQDNCRGATYTFSFTAQARQA